MGPEAISLSLNATTTAEQVNTHNPMSVCEEWLTKQEINVKPH